MAPVVLCDFDGTIINFDSAEHALRKFAKGDWEAYDEQFARQEIGLEECVTKQFAMIQASKSEIEGELDKHVSVRPGFDQLVEYCRSKNVELVIVSAGLDFYIRHFLKEHGWFSYVRIHAIQLIFTPSGVEAILPVRYSKTSSSFKDDLVIYFRQLGNRVIYIGDTRVDYPAARAADFAFAIKGSRLAEICEKDGVPYQEITDFHEVIELLQK